MEKNGIIKNGFIILISFFILIATTYVINESWYFHNRIGTKIENL